MQGWRRSMEDAHIANLDIGDGVAIFGVFDGHGGKRTTTNIILSKLDSYNYIEWLINVTCFFFIGSEVA
jgi:serine/threonine protein phosphatase PrpC